MSLKNKTIAFIGAGNMGGALIDGLLKSKSVMPEQIIVTDTVVERADYYGKRGVVAHGDNSAAADDADVIVLAIKPQQMSEVLLSFKPQMTSSKLLVSIAAGIPTARIEKELGGEVRVVRAMPNTPALKGVAATALCKGQYATDKDLGMTEIIFGAVGITVRVEERLLNAVTALSGSGPAYIFYVAEAMIKAGTEIGLPSDVAEKLTLQTIFGAGTMLVESSDPPKVLRERVSSRGGTTEAGLKVMTERKLKEIFAEAIQAAEKRGRELSGG